MEVVVTTGDITRAKPQSNCHQQQTNVCWFVAGVVQNKTSPVVFHDFPGPYTVCRSTSFFNTVNATFAAHRYGTL